MNINQTSRLSQRMLLVVLLVLAFAAVLVTAVSLNLKTLLLVMMIPIIVGGLAAYLKSGNRWTRVAGLLLFGIGLFWLLYLPIVWREAPPVPLPLLPIEPLR